MFKRLVVPLDGTPEAASALPLAATIARATDASICALRVVPSWQLPVPAEVSAANVYLADVAADLARQGLTVTTSIQTVAHAKEIAVALTQEARAQQADLIVMATHARTSADRVTRGSIAETVINQAGIPVLLLEPGESFGPTLSTILVPLDGTAAGNLALDAACDLARAANAELFLLRVVVPQVKPPLDPVSRDYPGEVELLYPQSALDDAQHSIHLLCDQLRGEGLRVAGHAVFGPVIETILDTAARIHTNLIIMSTHAHTGMVRAVIGSVADAIVRQSNRPILLIKRPHVPTLTAAGSPQLSKRLH